MKLEGLTGQEEHVRLMYSEYGTWARHYHNFVWVSWVFVITLGVGALVSFRNISNLGYSIVSAAVILLVWLSHQLASGNRKQWAECKEVQNQIEILWGVRDGKDNARESLATVPDAPRSVRVQTARMLFSGVIIGFTILAAVAKWLGLFEGPPL